MNSTTENLDHRGAQIMGGFFFVQAASKFSECDRTAQGLSDYTQGENICEEQIKPGC